MISPTRPLCTPSGLMAMKVRSSFADIRLKAQRKYWHKKHAFNKFTARTWSELTPLRIWHRGLEAQKGVWVPKPLSPSPITFRVTVTVKSACLTFIALRKTVCTVTDDLITDLKGSGPCINSTLSNHLYIVTHFITRVLYVFSAPNDYILYYMSIKSHK